VRRRGLFRERKALGHEGEDEENVLETGGLWGERCIKEAGGKWG